MRLQIEEEVAVLSALQAHRDAARRTSMSLASKRATGVPSFRPRRRGRSHAEGPAFVGSDGVTCLSNVVFPADVGAVVQ